MLLRRLRGILVAALMWAVLWIPLGVAVGLIRYARTPPYDLITDVNAPLQYPPAFPIVAQTTLGFVIWGAVVGLFFAVFLLAGERQRAIHELSTRRFAAWGVVAALALPVVLIGFDWTQSDRIYIGWAFGAILILSAVFGAVCSVGMLRMAKKASS
jgi:hypothetical protein